uniref:Uncharacterized protein n=1 Tax=Sphaerodactylus townsendi TaxID=933632 RepID=A0ACB8GAW2_9SAUR
MMAEGGGGGPRQKALSLLEAARCRYESLQISDDVFGESGQDSSGNPFYSTTADSASEEEDDERPAAEGEGGHRGRTGGRPGSKAAAEQQLLQAQGGSEATCSSPVEQQQKVTEEEEEDQRGWSQRLRDTTTPSFKDTSVSGSSDKPNKLSVKRARQGRAGSLFQVFVRDAGFPELIRQPSSDV